MRPLRLVVRGVLRSLRGCPLRVVGGVCVRVVPRGRCRCGGRGHPGWRGDSRGHRGCRRDRCGDRGVGGLRRVRCGRVLRLVVRLRGVGVVRGVRVGGIERRRLGLGAGRGRLLVSRRRWLHLDYVPALTTNRRAHRTVERLARS